MIMLIFKWDFYGFDGVFVYLSLENIKEKRYHQHKNYSCRETKPQAFGEQDKKHAQERQPPSKDEAHAGAVFWCVWANLSKEDHSGNCLTVQLAASERSPAVLERGIPIVEFFKNVANKEPNWISANPLHTMNLKCQVRSYDGFKQKE